MIYALDLPDFDDPHDLYQKQSADPERLILARYVTSAYRLDNAMEAYQLSNAGLLRSAMLKRLESSPHALRATLDTKRSRSRTIGSTSCAAMWRVTWSCFGG